MHTAVNQLHMVSKAWVLSWLQTAPYCGSLDPYCEGNLILNAQVNRGWLLAYCWHFECTSKQNKQRWLSYSCNLEHLPINTFLKCPRNPP